MGQKDAGSIQRQKLPDDVVVKVSGMGAISAAVRDYTTDPYFVKKAEAAKEVIEKIGLPKKKYVTE